MDPPDLTTRCPNCSEEVNPWDSACTHCGFALDGEKIQQHEAKDICIHCGASIREGMLRCRECGQRIERKVSATPTVQAVDKPTPVPPRRRKRKRRPGVSDDAVRRATADVPQTRAPESAAATAADSPQAGPDATVESQTDADAAVDPEQISMISIWISVLGDEVRRHVSVRRLKQIAAVVLGLSIVAVVAAWIANRDPSRPPEFVRAFDSPAGPCSKLVYADDGSRLIAGTTSGQVVIWNTATGQSSSLRTVAHRPIVAIALSPDGFLAAADEAKNIVGWEPDSEQPLSVPGVKAPVSAIVFRYSKSTSLEVILGTAAGELIFLNTKGRGQRQSKHNGGVKAALCIPGRDLLVTAGGDGQVVWMNAESRIATTVEKAHQTEVDSLALSPDAARVASADWNGRIVLWNVATEKQIAQFSQPDAVSAVAFLGNHLVTGSWDGRIRFWSVEQKEVIREIDTGGPIFDLAVNPEGSLIATTSSKPQVDLWKVPAL